MITGQSIESRSITMGMQGVQTAPDDTIWGGDTKVKV